MANKIGKRQRQDIEWLAEHDPSLGAYRDSTVFVTGATGLIGSELVRAFLEGNRRKGYGIHVIAAVRDRRKAEWMYADLMESGGLELYVSDIRTPVSCPGKIDYIFHTASVTTSKQMVEHPVATIETAVEGTGNILKFANKSQVKGMVYLSSMEMYGNMREFRGTVSEEQLGYLDLGNVRSCYPEGKRICECLCTAYAAEYQVPVTIARLAQTFGPGILESDQRVYAQFAKSVISKEHIVLHSDGTSEGNYCDIRDAVQALLLLGIKGQPGEAYNIANEASHMQIREMAEMVANEIADGKIRVVYEIPESDQTYGYAPKTILKLSSEKLRQAGWNPVYTLKETYSRMIEDLIDKSTERQESQE